MSETTATQVPLSVPRRASIWTAYTALLRWQSARVGSLLPLVIVVQVLMADLTVWSVVALPGIASAVVIAWLRFDLDLAFDWPLLTSTALLVTVSAAAVGYMVAVVLPPLLTQVVSQALVFFVVLFSPISFPEEQLPGWFQAMHDVLPIRPAADLLRAGLASTTYTTRLEDLGVLVVWCAVGIAVSMTALVRRS